MPDSKGVLVLAWIASILATLLCFGILLIVGSMFPSLLLPVWVVMGVSVYVYCYIFGPFPGGEPFSTYCFMLFTYLVMPPFWAGFMVFDYLEEYRLSVKGLGN